MGGGGAQRRRHGGQVRTLRIAEVVRQDVTIGDGGIVNFRCRLAISFKFESGE